MASGNPTLDAAEAGTGIEPLNAGPKEPQPLKQEPGRDTIPSSLSSLPPNSAALTLPLSTSSKLDTHQNTSSLPSASGFEDLVKAEVRPPGPARAEDVGLEEWGRVAGAEYAELVMRVQEAVGGEEVKVYKVVAGVGKAEWYVAGLDVEGERIVAVRVTGLNG